MANPKPEYFPIIQPSPVIYVLRLFAIFVVGSFAYAMLREDVLKIKLMGGLMLLTLPLLFRWTIIQASSEGIRISRTLLLRKRYLAWRDIASVSLQGPDFDSPITLTIWLQHGTKITQDLIAPQLLFQDLWDILKQHEVTVETNLSLE